MAKTDYSSPHSRDLLVHGIASAKVGEKELAYRYLERYLYQDPPAKERIDAMYYLSLVSPTETEQREWLDKILSEDPVEGRARRRLAVLNGELDTAKIVDPDRLPATEEQEVKAENLDRFTCPQCGGRMSYAADGLSLICEYCEAKSRRDKSEQKIEEGSFLLALATEKGHSKAVNTLITHCTGCGAEFIIPKLQLSWQCPFCESNYSVVQKEEREIVVPEAIIPFQLNQDQAYKAITDWWQKQEDDSGLGKFDKIWGVYLPVWTFDVGGFTEWQLEEQENRQWYPQSSTKAIFYDDVLVPATKKHPQLINQLVDSYDLAGLVPFDNEYLANFMAESYAVTAGDGAINARKLVLDAEYKYIRDVSFKPIRNLHINSRRITVEQFKLILIPVWSGMLEFGSERFPILLNGQSGKLFSTLKSQDKSSWFSKIIHWLD